MDLLQRIRAGRPPRVGIIGLGYVGLPCLRSNLRRRACTSSVTTLIKFEGGCSERRNELHTGRPVQGAG